MAGDYIPMDHDLPDKPEVLAIIEATGETVEAVVFRLFLLWRMADRQTTDGVLIGVGPRSLAARLGGKPSFWEAVAVAGWLTFENGSAIVPGFVQRFKKSAMVRLEESRERKQQWRDKKRTEQGTSVSRYKAGENRGTQQGRITGQPCDKAGDNRGTPPGQSTGQPCDKASPEPEPEPEPEPRFTESSRVDHVDFSLLQEKWDPQLVAQVRRRANELFRRAVAFRTNEDRAFLLKVASLVECGALAPAIVHSAIEACKQRKEPPANAVAYFTSVLDDECRKAGVKLGKLLAAVELPPELTARNGGTNDESQ
jgi:hypothetical protein